MQAQIADVQSPRQGQRDRHALQAQELVDPQKLRQPLSAIEEQGRLLAADTGDGHDLHAGLAGELHVALAAVEVDDVALPRRAEHLVVAARVDQERARPAGLQRQAGVLGVAAMVPNLRSQPRPGRGHHEVVGELEEGAFDAEVRGEGEGEDDRVGRDVAAAVVTDQQDRLVGGYAVQTADVGPEVQRGQQPGAR